jgi:alkylation response protein AidB-like acyl-CoA dehydrogenase
MSAAEAPPGDDGSGEDELRATVRKWARERVPVAHLRALRDAGDVVGFSRERWRELAALGLAGVIVPEGYGGAGMGWSALGVVADELGRTLAPLPWLAATLGAGALVAGGTEAQRRAELPAICAGERLVALAHDEGTRHQRQPTATTAERSSAGWVVRGDKTMVLDGHVADALVVSARSGAGTTLFLVDARRPGVTVERLHLVDSRNAARVRFDVTVGEDAVVGACDRGAEILEPLLDRAQVALAAEMLGGADELFARTLAYLKTRKQFGVLIGSFQALQHRAAQLHIELLLLRAVVAAALAACDGDGRDLPLLACAAKARAADVGRAVAAEAVQMHGGIGVTDDLDVGLYYKRVHVAASLFGDAAWQRDRYAQLSGY